MSKAALKKAMKGMSAEQLAEMIIELYDARKEAKDYLEYWLNPDPKKALEEAFAKIDKMFFFISSGKNRKQPTATELKKLVSDFEATVFDSEMVAKLLMRISINHYNWVVNKKSGYLSAEASVRRSFEHYLQYVESHDLMSIHEKNINLIKEHIDDFFSNPPAPTRRHRRWW